MRQQEAIWYATSRNAGVANMFYSFPIPILGGNLLVRLEKNGTTLKHVKEINYKIEKPPIDNYSSQIQCNEINYVPWVKCEFINRQGIRGYS